MADRMMTHPALKKRIQNRQRLWRRDLVNFQLSSKTNPHHGLRSFFPFNACHFIHDQHLRSCKLF